MFLHVVIYEKTQNEHCKRTTWLLKVNYLNIICIGMIPFDHYKRFLLY